MPSTHADFRELACIDVAPLRSADPRARAAAAARIGAAARQAGFFYVTGHELEPSLVERLMQQARQFFAQPLASKLRYYIGLSHNHRGYVPEGEEVFYGGSRDRKEAFDLSYELPADDPDVLAGTPMLGPNVWPDLPAFREDVSAYYAAVFALGRTLARGLGLALGLDEAAFDGSLHKPPSQLRLIHYPARSAGDADSPGIAPHTDYEMFTILHATCPGLEVQNGAGEWIDAPPVPGAFLVNIGDMLETWTNGELMATSHRVRAVTQERYAFPLFFSCDYHTEVAPLSAFVSAQRPAAYAPLLAGTHLFAQTVQSFTYLKQRLARGELSLPDDARPLASFGRAKHEGA